MKLIPKLSKTQREAAEKTRLIREIKHREAKIGGELFGPIGPAQRREFFWLDGQTWIWHEEWVDANKQPKIITTRYDIRPSGVLKSQDGQGYRYIDRNEANNLYQAILQYKKRVTREVYGMAV
ncbi:MAG TPA: hypothetical protein VMR95_02575 [Candidatus Binatia bacterium]|nr:hypothetical protein [Candidatus Binatia bacterium]